VVVATMCGLHNSTIYFNWSSYEF